MPIKTKAKSSLLDASIPKRKRGRPRKIVALEVLHPFGKQKVTTGGNPKSLGESEPSETKPSKRRVNPTTSDQNYTPDEVEFMNALAEFKRASGRTFPTCSEILGVLRSLGYEKVL